MFGSAPVTHVHVLLRREGWRHDQNKTRRIYRKVGLQLGNKTPKRRVKAKLRDDRRPAARSNETWAMDFVHEQLRDLTQASRTYDRRYFLALLAGAGAAQERKR